MDFIEIEIVNWDKYNPRSDRKNHTWFRLQNTVLTDPQLHALTAVQKFLFVCFLAEASKSGGCNCKIYTKWMSYHLKIESHEIEEAIQLLTECGVIRLPSGNHLPQNDSLRTDGRTDERTLCALNSFKKKQQPEEKAKDEEKTKDFVKLPLVASPKEKSEEEIYLMVPVLTRDKIESGYEAKFIESAMREFTLYHSSTPDFQKWSGMKVGRKFTAWLLEKKRREGKKDLVKSHGVDKSFCGVTDV